MTKPIALLSVALALLAGWPGPAAAADVRCSLSFSLSGWSAFFKRSDGLGTITCSNGQRMNVRLRARGGGPSLGRSTIDDGRGEFSAVFDISDLLGAYVTGEATAGAITSASGRVMTKGPVSLALSGTGRGWELGVSFGRFTIERVE